MQEIVFATNNQHKLSELRRIVGERFHILSLSDIGCHDDIPETADTLAGNALQKARYVKEHYGYDWSMRLAARRVSIRPAMPARATTVWQTCVCCLTI